uniref:Uncharacterized protein n=1 Tax=Plectus sambesii TaxID=2011161 RepID=A0A914V8M3_9BILA
MSEFDRPAEYHVLMAQKAFQLIRRGDQTRDKNKRDISHLREKLAAYSPVDGDRSELAELDKTLSETKIAFDEETRVNIAALYKAKDIRERNSVTSSRVKENAQPLIESLKAQTEAVCISENNTRLEMVNLGGELRAFTDAVDALPLCKTYGHDQLDILAPLKAESALLRSQKNKELQELKESDGLLDQKIADLDIESAQLDVDCDDEKTAIAQIDRSLALEEELKAERDMDKEEALKELGERESASESVAIEANAFQNQADVADKECEQLQAEVVELDTASQEVEDEQEENALTQELHSLETDRRALDLHNAKAVGENQQKLDALQSERATTLKALQEQIADAKAKRDGIAGEKEELTEMKRFLRHLSTDVGDLQNQRRIAHANRSALEASINVRKINLQARKRSKRKADQAQQAAARSKKAAQSIPADPLPKSADRPIAQPRTPSCSQQPAKKTTQTINQPSATQQAQRRVTFAKSPKKPTRPTIHPTAGRTTAADLFDIFAFDDED